jgi:hypothetical protein
MTGQLYGTAKRGAPKIQDEGKRVLQTKVVGDEYPRQLKTRKADVGKPLLAVCDLVDHQHAVLFDSGGSYAINKRTGVKSPFTRNGKDWELKLTLEAPDTANAVTAGIMAQLAEVKARAEHPAVELVLGGGEVIARVSAPTPAHYNREEPLFRLAVPR